MEYVLVAQDRRFVEVYEGGTDAAWKHRSYEASETVELSSLGVRFAVAELYDAAGLNVA